MRLAPFGKIERRLCRVAKRTLVALAVLLLLVEVAEAQVTADDVSDFVVFGNNAVTYQGFTNSLGAPVGTNGDLNHLAGIGTFDSLLGGGVLNGANTNARQRVAGDVIFNDSVRINELSRVGGNLHSFSDVLFEAGAAGDGVVGGIVALGSVDLGAFNQAGSIGADGDVTLRPSARVLGDVGSNGNVSLETAAQVVEHVMHAGTLTVAPLATVGSSSVGATFVLPTFYPGVFMPVTPTPPVSAAPPTVLPLFASQTLAPGHYSDLILQGSNDVFLSAGDYFFNNINMTGTFADLHLDLTGGQIRIFVNDDVTFNRLSVLVNGVPQASANPSLAADVVLEAHGDIVLSGEFFGGVFAAKGIATLESLTDVIGSVVAADEVIAESAADVSFVRNNYLTTVPEPAVFALGVLGFAAVCVARRRLRIEMQAAVALVALLLVADKADAQTPSHISDYVVFGNNAVTYQGFTNSIGAPVGTNGNLNHLAGVAMFDSLLGGGMLNGANTNARQRVSGDVKFFSNISINELSRVGGNLYGGNILFEAGAAGDGVAGTITAFGTVDFGAFNQAGNIIADGNVTLRPSARVLGEVGSNGDVTLETAAKVDGRVIHSGALTLAPLAMVGSSAPGLVLTLPEAYTPRLIPQTPTPPPSLAPPIILPLFGERTLAPGHYSDLILEGSNDVFLSSGDYYFNNIEMFGTFADLHLDLTGGPIRIFVHDDARFNRLSTFVNGVPQATANPALAADVILEAHGHVTLSGEFFGGVFAPHGEVALETLTNVIGSVVAGDEVIAASAANVTYVRNNYLTAIPEPTALVLSFLAAGALAVCVTLHGRRRIAG